MKRSAPDGLEEAIRVATVGVGFGVGVTVGTRVFVAVGTAVWVLVGVTVMVCVGVLGLQLRNRLWFSFRTRR